MPLLTIWKSAPDAVNQMSIEQIVTSAGDGNLKDDSICSSEFREYISQASSGKLASYVEHCLTTAFDKSGLVLQDLVNELGRRLDYKVTNGLYQGVKNGVGFDGLWLSPEGHTIIAEVKTTDAYRISLDTIAGYRSKLQASGQVAAFSSILIVVGRKDTGELESQVRGSRYAWDIRLISVDALIKVVQLKEGTEGSETGLKIRSLLAPMEYTRLDGVIDVVFTAAKDVEEAVSTVAGEVDEPSQTQTSGGKEKGVWQLTDATLLQNKRDEIVVAMSKSLDVVLINKSRAQLWNASHNTRLACTISKRYTKPSAYPYWFGYRSQWHKFLSEADTAYMAFGCMDLPISFAIPLSVMTSLLDSLNTTSVDDDELYWHIHIVEPKSNHYGILLHKKAKVFSLDPYVIKLNSLPNASATNIQAA
jgi:hypothetical protein